MTVDPLPVTEEESRIAILGFSAVLGGGIIAYEAARSIREGDFLKTDAYEGKPRAGLVALGVGGILTAMSAREAAKEVGWKPLLLGAAGITAFVAVARAIRG